MPSNPLYRASNSPTNTTKPSKAVNQTDTHVRLTHNTFDNSFFNFKTQRYGQYEPFWWKVCVPGDNEPYSNSHNVRSLPFASPILSPMTLNKDYFMVPRAVIQPNSWEYIFKTPTQGDDVPLDAQNIFPLFKYLDTTPGYKSIQSLIKDTAIRLNSILDDALDSGDQIEEQVDCNAFLALLILENFFSSGSLLYSLGFKFNPLISTDSADNVYLSFDEYFDAVFNSCDFSVTIRFDDPDDPSGYVDKMFYTNENRYSESTVTLRNRFLVDRFTFLSLLRSNFANIIRFNAWFISEYPYVEDVSEFYISDNDSFDDSAVDSSSLNGIRMDVINAYQLACAQYYVNPRVDFLYNAQLYRDNFIQLVRTAYEERGQSIYLDSFDMNGIPVLYDYLSTHYYNLVRTALFNALSVTTYMSDFDYLISVGAIIFYLFGYRNQLRFGNYITDSRTQALGYGQPGSDVVQVFDDSISVTDMSQKLVLERYRGAVAHLDNTAEDYLSTMFHEQMPPDFHFPKFIAHSEFAISGEEITNTTSDDQGNIVTNLKSGQDSAEFNIEISLPCILIGMSYISIPEIYSQIKERAYFHEDRYDEFQSMLQYFGDQGIYNREVSDELVNPADSYGYTSRNGEYKQRLSQVSGAFLHSLRSWVFTVDLPKFAHESSMPRLAATQSPVAIRTFDFEFNRFLSRQSGLSLGTGFHFIMQYNNKNVDNRPMDINPLPLYPTNKL